jgi:hypothetical protein
MALPELTASMAVGCPRPSGERVAQPGAQRRGEAWVRGAAVTECTLLPRTPHPALRATFSPEGRRDWAAISGASQEIHHGFR